MKKKTEPPVHELTILEEAQKLIYGDRQSSYGSATDNFSNTAIGWTILLQKKLNADITAEDVGMMMVWLKMARQVHKPQKDNLVDAAGYLGCIEKVQKGQ